MSKKRLDQLMFERSLSESREKAKALIMEGIVYVNGNKENKPGVANLMTIYSACTGKSYDDCREPHRDILQRLGKQRQKREECKDKHRSHST